MMKTLLSVHDSAEIRYSKIVTGILLVGSAIAVAAAPALMPASYSWTAMSVSESAAQGVSGAWLARLGFLLYGLAVIRVTFTMRGHWARAAYWLHMVFGLSMLGTAAFSHKPWLPDAPVDAFEDWLHTVTATAMGLGFVFGVMIRWTQRRMNKLSGQAFDIAAFVITTAISVIMANDIGIQGLLQRVMFLTGYLWYGVELVRGQTASVAGKSTGATPGAGPRA